MNLDQQIVKAFEKRQKPRKLVEQQDPTTPEQTEARWFAGRDWRDITWEDWDSRRDALYAFTPEAFAYYLPSILTLSARRPDRWLGPADALLQVLDRSPTIEYWDSFISSRLFGLQVQEYEAIKGWLLALSGNSVIGSEDTLGRAFDTVDLLQKETERLRSTLGRSGKPGADSN